MLENLGWRRAFVKESQLQVIDDPIHHGIVCEEGNDAHLALAFGMLFRQEGVIMG